MSANKITVSPTTNTITVASPGTVGPQGGTGAAGTNGSDGTNGYSAHVGSGPPGSSLGADNDIYFDNTNHNLYKKISGSWNDQGSYSSGSGGVNSFETIAVAGQNNVVADSATDTLTLAAGSNVTLTTNDSSDTITVASSDTTANETITLSGDVSGSGTTAITATLDNSGVSAGTYGSASLIPSITVDSKGRVTAVSTNGVSSSAGGTVSSVAVSGSDGIEVDSGSPITGSGTIALGVNKTSMLSHLNVADGAEVNVQADWNASSGDAQIANKPTLATVATSGSYNDLSGKPTIPSGDVVSDTSPQLGGTLQTNSNNILSAHNSTDVIADGTAHFTVTVSGGKYYIDGVQQATLKLERNKSYVFDNPNYSSHPLYFQTTDNSGSYDSSNTVSYQSGNSSQTVILRIPNSAPDTLYYRCFSHGNMGGSVSMRQTLTSNQVIDWTSSGAGTIHATNYTDTTANESITLSGDVTGSGTTGITATLANSGVSAATYGSATQVPVFAVDAKGRVTSVTNTSITSTGIDEGTAIALAIAL